jgi:hypothetical protein
MCVQLEYGIIFYIQVKGSHSLENCLRASITLSNANSLEFLRRNLFLSTLRILKHSIIPLKGTVATVNNGVWNNSVRRVIADADYLMNKVDRFVVSFTLEFNSGIASGLSIQRL